ncbi:MAG: hypothetical protein Q4G34_04240 [Micrococcus sp.]|nr:hypothetical protein [Micrococcus sp.]
MSTLPHASSANQHTTTLRLTQEQAVTDLEQFAQRAKRIQDSGMRLQVVGSRSGQTGGVLAQYVCVMQPRGLGDDVPTVLGLRTVGVEADDAVQGLDVTVPLAAVLERTARMKDTASVEFAVPPTQTPQSWTALTPPRTGWTQVAEVANEDLVEVATSGVAAMREALPTDPGDAVVQKARAAVWGQMLGEPAVVPAGSAFAAYALGFLVPGGRAQVLQSGPWTRLDTVGGFVLHRPAVAL